MSKLFIDDMNGYTDVIECEENNAEGLIFFSGEVIEANCNTPPSKKQIAKIPK